MVIKSWWILHGQWGFRKRDRWTAGKNSALIAIFITIWLCGSLFGFRFHLEGINATKCYFLRYICDKKPSCSLCRGSDVQKHNIDWKMPGYMLSTAEKQRLGSKYMCNSCGLLLRDAMQTTCGHFYCSSCLASLFR